MSALPLLIVDGYNVIRASPRYSGLAGNDLETARARLVEDVAAYAQGRYSPTVVFDGGSNPSSDGRPHHVAGVTILFSRYGQDADAVVEALAARARDRGRDATVATSDADTQYAVMGRGVARLSSAELSGEMEVEARDWHEDTPAGSVKGRVEDRVDPDVRAKLMRWARGSASG